jgi:hypothetical protein
MNQNPSLNKYLSQLTISLNVKGDIEFKIPIFLPNMIDHSVRDNYNNYNNYNSIYNKLFVPNLLIDTKDLIYINDTYKIKTQIDKKRYDFQSKIKMSDYTNILSNPQYMERLVIYLKDNNFKPENNENEKNEATIKNISTILSILFDKNQVLKYNQRRYNIHSYIWNNEYTINTLTYKNNDERKNQMLNYKINVDLYVLDESKKGTKTEQKQLSCKLRKLKLYNELNTVFPNLHLSTANIFKSKSLKKAPKLYVSDKNERNKLKLMYKNKFKYDPEYEKYLRNKYKYKYRYRGGKTIKKKTLGKRYTPMKYTQKITKRQNK